MKVLLCGGGTGGHVMPAIAIAEIIEKSFTDTEIAFAGRTGGAENEAYIKTGHKLYTVDIEGISRSLSIRNAVAVFKAIKSGRIARSVIMDFAPDLIIGTGGYVCYPFIRQGQRLKVKTLMHESNVSPGLVTRVLGPKCQRLLLNLEGTKDHLRKTDNTVIVGNPTRSGFDRITKVEAKRRLGIPQTKTVIVSFGGSLGAGVLNEAVLGFIKNYVIGSNRIYHIHATGRNYFDDIKKNHDDLFESKKNVKVIPYIEDMPTVLRAADIAITRSGAMTVSELAACGVPSILIPSPNVTANHQYYNAKYMEKRGAAILLEEKELTFEKLTNEVERLIRSDYAMHRMSVNARNLAKADTARLIAKAISEVSGVNLG